MLKILSNRQLFDLDGLSSFWFSVNYQLMVAIVDVVVIVGFGSWV